MKKRPNPQYHTVKGLKTPYCPMCGEDYKWLTDYSHYPECHCVLSNLLTKGEDAEE